MPSVSPALTRADPQIMHKPHPQPFYRPDIDGLRGIAVLMVLIFHLFPSVLPGGFVGVDVFFVISGYLITQILATALEQQKPHWLPHFFAQRLRRLLPALLTVISVSLLMGWAVLFSPEYRLLGWHAIAGVSFVSNLLLWHEAGYFDPASDLKPFLHLWSLGIEAQFYLLWPLLLAWAWQGDWKRRWWMLLGVASLSFGLGLAWVNIKPVAAFYAPYTRMWELLAGSVLAFVQWPGAMPARWQTSVDTAAAPFALRWQVYARAAGPWLGLLLIGITAWGIDSNSAFPGAWALLPVAGTLLLIASGQAHWLNHRVLSHAALTGLGLISFPLYLWHWPLISLLRGYLMPTPTMAWRCAVLIVSVVLAYMTYRWIERPLRRGGKPALRRLLIAATGIALSGWLIAQGLIAPSVANVGLAATISTWQLAANRWWQNGELIETPAPQLLTRQQIAALEPFDFAYRQSCNRWTHRTYADDWCNAGTASDKPGVLLMGDSHANHYAAVLATVARHAPFEFYQLGRGQCPMLIGYGPPECRLITELAIRQLKQQPSLHTVVLAASFKDYVQGKRWVLDNLSASAAEFDAALAKTVQQILALNRKLVILLAVPGGASPRDCVRRGVSVMHRDPGCTLTRKAALENDRQSRARLSQFVKAYPTVKLFDPWPYLCDKDTCTMREGTAVLYSDGSHLSSAGAQYLGDQAEQALQALLTDKKQD